MSELPQTSNMIMTDPDMEVFKAEKESAYEFRKRRHPEWAKNYTLYRGKVDTNRLIQRQSVNVPLMKYALGSLMKEIDEPPQLYFKNLDNNEQKEVYYNEYWKEFGVRNGLPIKDTVDKKQALLYGRPFKKLNVEDGLATVSLVDPQHMLVHRFTDPTNLHSAKIVIETDIYQTLSEIVENPDYKSKGKKKLETFYSEQSESLEQDETLNKIAEKNQRMQDMGLEDALDPQLGETYVELNEIYAKEWSEEEQAHIIFLYTVATPGGAIVELQKRKLYEVIGNTVDNYWYDHFPYNTWATDPEATDFWSDAPADTIRGANEILNSWLSQLVENRTLRNYNMHYYDSSNEQFVPQTFTPEPWGWYPLPGKPSDVMSTVQVPDLSESLDEIDYVKRIAEQAVATTSAQTGEVEKKSVTLGEVELALANAQERVKTLSMYYNEAWKEFGMQYIKLLEAVGEDLEPVTITKAGRLGKRMYTKEITPKQWLSKSGYTVEVKLVGEKLEEDANMLERLNATLVAMPNNVPLRKIYNRKLMDFAGLTVEERAQVEEFMNQNVEQPLGEELLPEEQPMGVGAGQPVQAQVPTPEQLANPNISG